MRGKRFIYSSDFSALSHYLFISMVGLKETEECLTSDLFRQEVTDTGLTAQHCTSPQVEIPVIECVCVCVSVH